MVLPIPWNIDTFQILSRRYVDRLTESKFEISAIHFLVFFTCLRVLSFATWHLFGSVPSLLLSTRKQSSHFEQTQVNSGCTGRQMALMALKCRTMTVASLSGDHISASRPPTAFHLPALTKPVPPSLPELHISLGTAPGPSALGIGFSDIKWGRKKEALSFSLLLLRIPAHAVPEQKWLIYKNQTKQSLQNFLHFCSFGVYTRLCHDQCAT